MFYAALENMSWGLDFKLQEYQLKIYSAVVGMRHGDGSSVAHAFCETEEPSPCLVPDGRLEMPLLTVNCTLSIVNFQLVLIAR
jgi:hypothetical protein